MQNEKAIADVSVDNSESLLKVDEIEFEIIQTMYLRCHNEEDEEVGEEFRRTFPIICNIDRTHNVFAGRKAPYKNQMQLDMGSIQYHVSTEKKKKIKDSSLGMQGEQVIKRTAEEIFLSSQLAPATNAKYIRNSYHLKVSVKHDSDNMCSSVESPSVSIPLTIIPTTQLETYSHETPEGFNPSTLGSIKFELIMQKY